MAIFRPDWIDDGSPIDDPLGFGERAVAWLKQNRHPKNPAPGNPFNLDPWQERIIRKLYGARDASGRRQYTRLLLQLPRGNRKTSLAAAIVLLHTFGPEKVPGNLVQSAASTRKQARECFEEVSLIVSLDKRYKRIASIQDYKSRVASKRYRTRYEAISSQALSQHGSTPSVVVVDELHAWETDKHRELWKTMSSALDKLSDSLMVVLTTAGRGQENLAYDQISYAKKVQAGEITDPSLLPVIFEATKDEDWRDEAVWHAVNPGLKHGYPSLDMLRKRVVKAENSLVEREVLQQLYMNVWLDQSAAPFVDMAIYDRCASVPVDFDKLKGRPAFLGVDLSDVSDLTAVVAAWPTDDGGYIVRPWFFCPEASLNRKSAKDRVDYRAWADQGLIIPTPGSAVDYAFVEQTIRNICAEHDVRQIAFDPWRAQKTQQNLMNDGLPVVDCRQGYLSMAPACDEVERAIITGKLYHAGNPILRWNFDNILVQRDPAGNRKPDKSKSRDKIDGAVAALMAVRFASLNDNSKSIYDRDADELDALFAA